MFDRDKKFDNNTYDIHRAEKYKENDGGADNMPVHRAAHDLEWCFLQAMKTLIQAWSKHAVFNYFLWAEINATSLYDSE
jgi:hypothetical protein